MSYCEDCAAAHADLASLRLQLAEERERRIAAEKRCERLRAALIELDRRLATVWNAVDGMIRLAGNKLHADDDEADACSR